MILQSGRVLKTTLVCLALTTSVNHAAAQSTANYPNRAMRWIVGYTPGGTADMMARAVGAKFTETWGQPVIVEIGRAHV